MLNILRNNPRAFLFALIIHLLIVGALAFSVTWQSQHSSARPDVKVIQAVMIDEAKIKAEAERKQALLREQQRKLDAEKRRQAELEKQRQAEVEKKQREEAQRKQAAQKKKEAAEQKRKAEAEAKRKLAETKRQEELRQQQAAEKKRLAEEERKRKIEAERKRVEAEKERQRKLEEELRRAEEEMIRQQQIAAEEASRAAARQRVLQSERSKYVELIRQRVSSKWLKPSGWKPGTECTVSVRLVPGAGVGQVIDVRIGKSCGDPLFDRSVENAVYSASPLPIPTAPELIDMFREISFTFRPEE